MILPSNIAGNKTLLMGGGIMILVVGGYLLTHKSATTTTATGQAADLTGLTNGLVYVPTSTNFTTNNQSGIFASNDPTLTSISNTGSIASTSSNRTITKNPRPPNTITLPPPQRLPPPNPVAPPSTGGGLLGGHIRFFPNYKNGQAYYRGPTTNGQIVPIPLPASTTYQGGNQGRIWYQSPPGSAGKLLTSGDV